MSALDRLFLAFDRYQTAKALRRIEDGALKLGKAGYWGDALSISNIVARVIASENEKAKEARPLPASRSEGL